MDKLYKEFFYVYLTGYKKTRELIKQEKEQKRNLLKDLIAIVNDTSSNTKFSQLETTTMIVNKLDTCYCDSMKLVSEAPLQMNRSEFREDITAEKKSIEKP